MKKKVIKPARATLTEALEVIDEALASAPREPGRAEKILIDRKDEGSPFRTTAEAICAIVEECDDVTLPKGVSVKALEKIKSRLRQLDFSGAHALIRQALS